MDIPVYLIAGFLDGGKTNFINGILEDGFAKKDRTLLLCCEEGDEEYNERFLKNVTVVTVENREQLTCSFLKECEKKYRPRQVLIEYNGMWPLAPLYEDTLPANWILYQIMTFVEGGSFDLYARNMGQLMMEKITQADLIVFNRCTQEQKDALRQRNLRMVNRRADIYLEGEDGESEDYNDDSVCPFDLVPEVLEIPDEDFGIWYVDVMDHPERYDGHLVRMKLVMCHSKKYPGIDCPGRFAMVCCENDVQFLGIIARGEGLEQYANHDWIEVTGRMAVENHPAYQGNGPVLNVTAIGPCEKPDPEVVTF